MNNPMESSLAVSSSSAPDVAALVRAARTGDMQALGALYDQFADVLFRTARRLNGSSDDAQDVVHDCFVGLPEALRHYNEQGSLESWLKRVVVRLVLMRRRRETRRREDALDFAPALESGSRTDATAQLHDIHRVINALPDSLRDVFVLKQIEGYAHEEIAQLLGITAGASRVRHTRALDALRRSLTASDTAY